MAEDLELEPYLEDGSFDRNHETNRWILRKSVSSRCDRSYVASKATQSGHGVCEFDGDTIDGVRSLYYPYVHKSHDTEGQ